MYTVAVEIGSLVFVGVFLYLVVRIMELKRKKADGE